MTDVWLLFRRGLHLLAISRKYIFNDGNKRTALFITRAAVLKRNGILTCCESGFCRYDSRCGGRAALRWSKAKLPFAYYVCLRRVNPGDAPLVSYGNVRRPRE